MKLDAYHLPGLTGAHVTTWPYRAGDLEVELRVPQVNADALDRQIDRLLAARARHLVDRPVREIAAAIGQAATRFVDVGSAVRATATEALTAVTGLSRPMVERVLDGMAADWREPRLLELLTAELGTPDALDAFVRRPGRRGLARAIGPELTVHVFSGNVPGVAVTSLIRSLLLKSATLGKTAAGEPILAPLFARALSDVDAGLGACLAVTYWAGGDETLEAVAIDRADAVIAYGGREAVESLRARSVGRRFVGYGHRFSFGVVAREALTSANAPRLAEEAALAAATFDQQGCVSPHLFYVERGGQVSPEGWSALLAEAFGRLETELPRGRVGTAEAAAIRQARAEAEFGQLAGRGHTLHASTGGTAWTVIHDPDPTFSASCLNRLVRVKPVGSIDEVPALVAPIGGILQTVGLAGDAGRLEPLANALAALGASRLAPFRSMPWPPPDWHHDGRPPLADLVRWADWEEG